MAAAPILRRETEVEIGERAADRDVPDREWRRRQLAGLLVEAEENRLALLGVGRKMDLRLVRGRALALVAPQQQEVEEAVAERLPAQRRHPRRQRGRNELRSVVQPIEIFADHRRVVEHGAVVQHQRRDLGQRIFLHQRRVRPGGGDHGAHAVETTGKPELVRRDHHLAHERRAGRPMQFHPAPLPPRGCAPSLRATRDPFAKGKKSAYWHKNNPATGRNVGWAAQGFGRWRSP